MLDKLMYRESLLEYAISIISNHNESNYSKKR